jgi:hypothetical protein
MACRIGAAIASSAKVKDVSVGCINDGVLKKINDRDRLVAVGRRILGDSGADLAAQTKKAGPWRACFKKLCENALTER